MTDHFQALERKITLVADLCRSLRTENGQLRQQLAAAEADKSALAERMNAARARLEALAEQLPETAENSLVNKE